MSIKYTYKGVEREGDSPVTLHTSGKYLEDDVVIEAEGGGSGYTVYFYANSFNDLGRMRINGGEAFFITQYMPGTNFEAVHIMTVPVETIKIWGFDHTGTYPTSGSSWARWRVHGGSTWNNISLSRSESQATTITLYTDIDLEIGQAACLSKGTLITMADGSKKPVEEIEIGDYVKGYTGGALRVRNSQKGLKQYWEDRDIWRFEGGYEITTCFRHEFYNVEAKRMKYINDWEIGEHAYTEDGKKVALLEHIHEDVPCMHFSLWCEDENYYSNGLLTGNRYTVPIDIS